MSTPATTHPRLERRQHGRNHSYAIDGRKVPGVTTILGAGLPAPALVEWAAKTTATYAVNNWDDLSRLGIVDRYERMRGARWEVLKAAGLRGTQIHDLAHKIVTGEPVEVPDAHRGPVMALAELMDDLELEPVLRETPVCNPMHWWAGTTDATVMIGGEYWLIDYKTGKGLYEKDALQVAAYANAAQYLDEDGAMQSWRRPDRVGLVHVTPDAATLHEVTGTDVLYSVFLHVQQVAQWLGDIKDSPVIGGAL